MSRLLKYPGKELELFDKAILWRKYLFFATQRFFGKEILEVGAGIGSFTEIYKKDDLDITVSEVDSLNYKILKQKFLKEKNIKIKCKFTKEFKKKFDTILYMSVLEHIKDDTQEIKMAISKLKKNGHLIICVPAHNYMYSSFDKEIGHYRRYEISFFKKLKTKKSKIIKCFLLDSMGELIYFVNKLIFSKEKYPSKIKIFIWDKIFIPFTFFLDFLTFYKFGKNIICIIKKNN